MTRNAYLFWSVCVILVTALMVSCIMRFDVVLGMMLSEPMGPRDLEAGFREIGAPVEPGDTPWILVRLAVAFVVGVCGWSVCLILTRRADRAGVLPPNWRPWWWRSLVKR